MTYEIAHAEPRGCDGPCDCGAQPGPHKDDSFVLRIPGERVRFLPAPKVPKSDGPHPDLTWYEAYRPLLAALDYYHVPATFRHVDDMGYVVEVSFRDDRVAFLGDADADGVLPTGLSEVTRWTAGVYRGPDENYADNIEIPDMDEPVSMEALVMLAGILREAIDGEDDLGAADEAASSSS